MLTQFFQQQWQKISIWHVLLIPVSWFFGLLSNLRRILYKYSVLKSYKLDVPVIVVGNISVGGTGKTPVVAWLAENLIHAGFTPGIVSRGYGGEISGEVTDHSAASEFGDEPVLLAQRTACPVWVGRESD